MRLKALRMPPFYVSSLLCPTASRHRKKAVGYQQKSTNNNNFWTHSNQLNIYHLDFYTLWPWAFLWRFFWPWIFCWKKSHGQKVAAIKTFHFVQPGYAFTASKRELTSGLSAQSATYRDIGMATPLGASCVQAEGRTPRLTQIYCGYRQRHGWSKPHPISTKKFGQEAGFLCLTKFLNADWNVSANKASCRASCCMSIIR